MEWTHLHAFPYRVVPTVDTLGSGLPSSSWTAKYLAVGFLHEKGIIVVRCDLRQIQSSSSRANHSRNQSLYHHEHVKVDRALLQYLSNSFCQFFRSRVMMGSFPTIEPTIPEFHTHEGHFCHAHQRIPCISEKLYGALEPKFPVTKRSSSIKVPAFE